ncbi:hypothetical protein BW723_01650 [Polaribacter reichenbachii]|nr:hypothetical protein BW723_01650 [Polaribacter reichenbachii]AUC20491.1 hypothetical protein BTO17_09650 [Polaribacter reichenbachii]
MKKISFTVLLFISISIYSQDYNFDKYQYIIVDVKFENLKGVDQYQTSSLTKFLLKKKGFKVFLSNETIPTEISKDRCLALFATVKDASNMLSTKSYIEIKDCTNKVVYESQVGRSKLKEFKKSHQDAIRKAYETMEDFEYTYNQDLVLSPKVNQPAHHPVKEGSKTVKVVPKVVKTPKVEKTIKVEKPAKPEVVKASKPAPVLYAQPKNNGFQLVNMKPEVVFIILKTNKSDVFIIKGKDGTLTKKGNNWVAEYYKNDQLVKEEYLVKF